MYGGASGGNTDSIIEDLNIVVGKNNRYTAAPPCV